MTYILLAGNIKEEKKLLKKKKHLHIFFWSTKREKKKPLHLSFEVLNESNKKKENVVCTQAEFCSSDIFIFWSIPTRLFL